jgi:hypothetical protein
MDGKMKYLITALIFAFVLAMSAFIAWCGGYDFDHRSADVAIIVFAALAFATLVAWSFLDAQE